MAPQQLFEQSYLNLMRFLLSAKHEIINQGSNFGLTGMQTITLVFLDTPRPMHSFKKLFNCDASNVTGIVDGLEAKELVIRYEDPSDRRVKMIKLQPAGATIRAALLNTLTYDEGPLFANLTSEELTTFIELLEKITPTSTEGCPAKKKDSAFA